MSGMHGGGVASRGPGPTWAQTAAFEDFGQTLFLFTLSEGELGSSEPLRQPAPPSCAHGEGGSACRGVRTKPRMRLSERSSFTPPCRELGASLHTRFLHGLPRLRISPRLQASTSTACGLSPCPANSSSMLPSHVVNPSRVTHNPSPFASAFTTSRTPPPFQSFVLRRPRDGQLAAVGHVSRLGQLHRRRRRPVHRHGQLALARLLLPRPGGRERPFAQRGRRGDHQGHNDAKRTQTQRKHDLLVCTRVHAHAQLFTVGKTSSQVSHLRRVDTCVGSHASGRRPP
eukprot:6197521-Pleurochrysis_carterae.AAC.1